MKHLYKTIRFKEIGQGRINHSGNNTSVVNIYVLTKCCHKTKIIFDKLRWSLGLELSTKKSNVHKINFIHYSVSKNI